MFGPQAGGFALGLFAALIGVAGIAGAMRTRRRRAKIAATYGATGGPIYTAVQIGCAGLLLLAGVGLMILAMVSRR